MLAQLAEMDAAAKAGTAASGAGAGVPTDGAVAAGGDDDDASAAAAATEALSNIDSRHVPTYHLLRNSLLYRAAVFALRCAA